MEERDYVLRLIQQVIQALAKIAGFRREGKQAETLKDIHEAYRDLLNSEPTTLHMFGADTLIEMFLCRGALEPLAMLMWEEAQIHEQTGSKLLGTELKEKALRLLAVAQANGFALGDEARAIVLSGAQG